MPTIWKKEPKSNAQKKHDSVSRYNRVERGQCADQARRDRLEANTQAWLLWYFPDVYILPFGPPHIHIIESAEYAIEHGTSTAVAAPRSTGKTTVLWGVNIKAVATGKKKFPVQLPWESKGVKQALRFWKNALCFNERFAADYPELCNPFVASNGSAQKLMALTWEDNGNNTGARLQLSEGKIILPDSRGILGSTTINGNPRGMNHSTEDGRVLRPDVVMIDDPQSREAAKSAAQVKEIIATIDSDVMGLGGAGKRMSALMACTVTCKNDVAEHYLTAPEWDAVRIKRITKWPVGWGDENSVAQKLWNEWAEIRLRGLEEKDGNAAAVAFYDMHKAEMTEGMSVSWENRFDSGQPDALYGAMWDYYRLGPNGFASEHQNEPLEEGAGLEPYTLTADLIRSKQEDRQAFIVPPWCVTKIASTDMNPSYALTSAIVGFGRDQTAAVVWYGLFKAAPLPIPSDLPSAERHRRVFEALVVHGKQLATAASRPDVWHIDASGEYFPTVLRFTERSMQLCGIPAIGCTGVGAKNYRTGGKSQIGQAREYCQMRSDVQDNVRRKWFAWHADYWKEIAQRAWLGSLGSPGSVSLFKGNHNEFAEQIVREKLRGKGDVGGMTLWNWGVAPGPHDYGDVMAQAFAAAAWQGIGTSGPAQRQQKYVEVRKCRVARET